MSIILKGTRGNQPAASSVAIGDLYFVEVEKILEESDGSVWFLHVPSSSGGGTGPAGATGAQGIQGISGIQGINGLNGLDGFNEDIEPFIPYDNQRVPDEVIGKGWITPIFDAADFDAVSSMTWTVQSGDISNFSYIKIGKTLIVTFYIDTSTVGGTPSTQLRIKLPGGFLGKKFSLNQVLYYSDNGTKGYGFVDVSLGGSLMRLVKFDGSNWALSTNATSVYGTVIIEVQ